MFANAPPLWEWVGKIDFSVQSVHFIPFQAKHFLLLLTPPQPTGQDSSFFYSQNSLAFPEFFLFFQTSISLSLRMASTYYLVIALQQVNILNISQAPYNT